MGSLCCPDELLGRVMGCLPSCSELDYDVETSDVVDVAIPESVLYPFCRANYARVEHGFRDAENALGDRDDSLGATLCGVFRDFLIGYHQYDTTR